ncbi:polyphosphate glucokinase [Arcanobacterium pluranimalium]|uniref:polyphosphate--glucose phosphotransferase n=1 Tax=Arcanobacterium pluranimalium TaxID=108028 RepID=UPI00195E4D8A|nr:ROK family protein [Arcanobacterium pluranimalium]MBM7825540.1 polyphosphate glucokinase [Arcanobacterium pluranimalium]
MKKKFRRIAIGIDIGGSGIKGAPVDLKSGMFIEDRIRIATPPDASPDAIADIVKEIVDSFDLPDDVPVGISFPAPILCGTVPTIANLSQQWAGVHANELFFKKLKRPVTVLNDADAAGYAEVHYGAAHANPGTILVLTLGTGIGSALVSAGVLVPNTELGHIILPRGIEAEKYASSGVFEREDLSFEEWAQRLQEVFTYLEKLFSPDLFIIGGGISKKYKKYVPMIDTNAPIIPAELRNGAGIVGAALMAYQDDKKAGKKK